VNDAVHLLTFARELRANKGLSPFDAVLSAAKIRLRPRVMTTIGILVGFILSSGGQNRPGRGR
jgi:multidrug efflux pump